MGLTYFEEIEGIGCDNFIENFLNGFGIVAVLDIMFGVVFLGSLFFGSGDLTNVVVDFG